MSEQMNQNADPAAGQGTGEKTFTQEDVNRIVQERLAKEKAKSSGDADFAKREQELARRELHMTAKEMLSEKGLPVQLYDALNCTDEESLKKSIETIERVFNDYKANIKPAFRGMTPADAGLKPSADETEDAALRRAMRIRG